MLRHSSKRSVSDRIHTTSVACRRSVTPTHLRIFIDPDLLQYDEVWAAAGTWHDVLGIEPHKLVEASEGLVTELKRG